MSTSQAPNEQKSSEDFEVLLESVRHLPLNEAATLLRTALAGNDCPHCAARLHAEYDHEEGYTNGVDPR